MKNYTSTLLIWVLLILSAVTYFAWKNVTLALLFATLSVLCWGTTSVLDSRPKRIVNGVNAADVKQYRKQHPGTSITQALDAIKNQK